MGAETTISWTDSTWGPVRGCSRISEGCRNCYAERIAARFSDAGQPYHGFADRSRAGSKWTGVVRLVPEHLADPLKWKKPRRIFVSSTSDVFHESLSNEAIAAIFGVMAAAPRHTFQVLTKRAKRMREWFAWVGRMNLDVLQTSAIQVVCMDDRSQNVRIPRGRTWPLSNVWLGVSVENQAAADERIPELLATPAAIRFLSCEPLIGEVCVSDIVRGSEIIKPLVGITWSPNPRSPGITVTKPKHAKLDWVIAGCESGPGARPCDVAWLRSLRDQCEAAGTAFFLKQAVGTTHDNHESRGLGAIEADDGSKLKSGGVIELPYLDGVQHGAFPVEEVG